MRWIGSTACGDPRFFLIKRILLFSVILCFLVAFNVGLADDLTDPNPDWEHPWDDLDHQDPDGVSPDDPPHEGDDLVLQFGGFDFWIIVHLQLAPDRDGQEKHKTLGSAQKRRGHVYMLIR